MTTTGPASAATTTSFPPGYRVMVTGHRSLASPTLVRASLDSLLERFLARFPNGLVAVSGMALGADIEFAEAALALGVPLVAAVPLPGQADRWRPEQRARWEAAMARAAHVVNVWTEAKYATATPGQRLYMRNIWMIDHSDAAIAAWSGTTAGGTWNAVRDLRKRSRAILVVDPATGEIRKDAP